MSLVHFLIDEAAALGPHEAINDMLSLGRGYGERVHLFYQNAAQLMRTYPDGQHQFVLGTTTNIFFAAHDWLTCEEISKRSGSATVVVASGGDGDGDSRQFSDGTGHGSVGASRNRSRNWSYVGKPLIRPEQVAALPERACISFVPGVGAPLLTWLTRCYEEPAPPTRRERGWQAAKNVARALLLAAGSGFLAVAASAVRIEPPARQVRPANWPATRTPPAERPAIPPPAIPKARD